MFGESMRVERREKERTTIALRRKWVQMNAESEKKPLHLEWWGTGHRCIGAVTEDGLPLHDFLLQMEL